jgi:hypothetical protein
MYSSTRESIVAFANRRVHEALARSADHIRDNSDRAAVFVDQLRFKPVVPSQSTYGFGALHTVDARQMAEILYPGVGPHYPGAGAYYDVIAAIAEPSSPAFWDMLRLAMADTSTSTNLPDLELV